MISIHTDLQFKRAKYIDRDVKLDHSIYIFLAQSRCSFLEILICIMKNVYLTSSLEFQSTLILHWIELHI